MFAPIFRLLRILVFLGAYPNPNAKARVRVRLRGLLMVTLKIEGFLS